MGNINTNISTNTDMSANASKNAMGNHVYRVSGGKTPRLTCHLPAGEVK